MRITRSQLRRLIREEIISEAKRSSHPKMRPGPLPDPLSDSPPQLVTLPTGFQVFHGSPQGGKISHPTGPAWFATERKTAVFHSPEAWSTRSSGGNEDKSPRVIKYRVRHELILPTGEYSNLAPLLAYYGAKSGIGSESLLRHGLDYFGWQTGAPWGSIGNFSEKDIEDFNIDQVTQDAVGLLSPRFDGIVSFLRYICENSDFEGWVARYDDGGSEVLLCNPNKHLKMSARQPVYRSKREKEWHDLDSPEEEEEKARIFRAEREIKKAEEADAAAGQLRNRDTILGHFFPTIWDKPNYSDPHVRDIVKNWQHHVSQEELAGISNAVSYSK
jgi:hypothetical protein